VIRHVVLLKLTDPSLAAEAAKRLEALAGEIPSVRSLEVGVDVLRSDSSYDVALVTTHDDLDGLRAYAEHPAHVEFLAWVRPHLADRVVVDAETG
jgi:hypothetical protein